MHTLLKQHIHNKVILDYAYIKKKLHLKYYMNFEVI